jgi:hypothetical protein
MEESAMIFTDRNFMLKMVYKDGFVDVYDEEVYDAMLNYLEVNAISHKVDHMDRYWRVSIR